jgi:transcriptional regulator with XRE-family HTH domain
MVINMVINTSDLLDKAKVIHNLPSDYKLALVMGISHSALTNYRQGKTLPDARIIQLICELTGDDPALIAVQIEAQRAKTSEARSLWDLVAKRLQAAALAAIFAAVCVGTLAPLPSYAEAYQVTPGTPAKNLYIVEHGRFLARRLRRWLSPLVRYLRGLLGENHHAATRPTTPARA